MDENQTNHLKAYGIAFSSLKKQNKVEWLLNYRGGSFIIDVNENTKRECLLKNVLYESLSIEKISLIYSMIEEENMELVILDKTPKIAVYSPPNQQPWDDAVTLALTYADIKYDIIFDANGNLSFPKISNSLSSNGIYVTTKFNIYNNIDTAKQFFKRKKSRTVLSGRTSTSNLDMFRMWMEDGKLKPVIEKTYSFDQYHEAYDHLSSGRAKGKLLIKIN